jgi:hypothetical protein
VDPVIFSGVSVVDLRAIAACPFLGAIHALLINYANFRIDYVNGRMRLSDSGERIRHQTERDTEGVGELLGREVSEDITSLSLYLSDTVKFDFLDSPCTSLPSMRIPGWIHEFLPQEVAMIWFVYCISVFICFRRVRFFLIS